MIKEPTTKLKFQIDGIDIEFLTRFFEGAPKTFSSIFKGETYPALKIFSPSTIIDVGANIGATSIFFSINYPKAKIFCFEPSSINFPLLEKNIEPFENIIAYRKGIYSEEKTEIMYIDPIQPGRNSIKSNWNKSQTVEKINLISLKKFLIESKIQIIDILKIDTEGCEVPILFSVKEYLKDIKILYIEYHSSNDRDEIRRLLENTHFVLRELIVGATKSKLDKSLIGKKNLEDVKINENLIVRKGEEISKEMLERLHKLKLSTIMVRSKEVGEIIFLNKKYKRQ